MRLRVRVASHRSCRPSAYVCRPPSPRAPRASRSKRQTSSQARTRARQNCCRVAGLAGQTVARGHLPSGEPKELPCQCLEAQKENKSLTPFSSTGDSWATCLCFHLYLAPASTARDNRSTGLPHPTLWSFSQKVGTDFLWNISTSRRTHV
jgi:hypothetical protein